MSFWKSKIFAAVGVVDLNEVHAARISSVARKALTDCDVRKAKPEEFADWVEGFLKTGGQVRTIYDTDMLDDFFVARKGTHVPALHGATRVTLLVPKGIALTTDGGNNHNDIYWMDGFKKSNSYVNVDQDVARVLTRRGYREADLLQGLVATGKMQPPAPLPAVQPPENSTAPAFKENAHDAVTLQKKVTVYRPLKLKL